MLILLDVLIHCKGKCIKLLRVIYDLIGMVMIEEELTKARDQENYLCYAGLVCSTSPPSHGSSSHETDIHLFIMVVFQRASARPSLAHTQTTPTA